MRAMVIPFLYRKPFESVRFEDTWASSLEIRIEFGGVKPYSERSGLLVFSVAL